MSPFRVRLGPKAMEDIDATIAWLAARSLSGARAWVEALDTAKAAVVLAPHSFLRPQEAFRLNRDLRAALFKTRHGKTYRIIFVIDGTEIIVLRVRGTGQPDLESGDL